MKYNQFEWDEASIEKFWTNVSKSPLIEFSFSKFMCTYLVRLIKCVKEAPCTVLDFGGGDGDLAEALLKEGYSVAIYEPSTGREDNILQKEFTKHKNFLGVVSPQSTQTTFDIVCCFEVLEHILPHGLDIELQSIYNFLQPKTETNTGGVFIGSVPCNENLAHGLCICPQCETTFHRWQHIRSFDENKIYDLLTKNKALNSEQILCMFLNHSLFFVAALEGSSQVQEIDRKWKKELDFFNETMLNVDFYRKELGKYKNELEKYEEDVNFLPLFTIAKSKNIFIRVILKFIRYYHKNILSLSL